MKKTPFAGASMLAIATAAITPASAADSYRSAPGAYKDGPAYVVVSNWTGFYAGINGGYGANADKDQFAVPRAGVSGVNPDGGFGGGQIGYNWQVPGSRVVLGAEADFEGSGVSGSNNVTVSDGNEPADVRSKSRLDWFTTFRGRVGYAVDTSLIYFTGGFAFGGLSNTFAINDAKPELSFTSKNTGTGSGYVLGGGYEYKFNPSWSIKAEYQYINLSKNDPIIAVSGGPLLSSLGVKVNDDAFHTVRIGLNYHVLPSYEPLK